METTTAPKLSQTAPWNAELTNPYRTRWTTVAGRYFRIQATTLGGLWDVDEINADGGWVDYVASVPTLAIARDRVARWVAHT